MSDTNPNPADIPVVILCGGQGTRIREASEKLPASTTRANNTIWLGRSMTGSFFAPSAKPS